MKINYNQSQSTLEELYLKAKEEYYIGQPIMTDGEFDELETYLKDLKSEATDIVDGENLKGVRYKHITPMLSLEKIQVLDRDNLPLNDIQKFINKCPQSNVLEITPKFDGNAINLIYKDGKLVQALTRGNENGGLDQTEKLKLMVPNTINIKGIVEIRGEIVINAKLYYSKWANQVNKKNPRNFVAGKISQDIIEIAALNDMDFIAYSIVSNDIVFDTFSKLKNNDFKIPEKIEYLYNVSNFEKIFKEFEEYRALCDYQLDGFVLKFPEEYRKDLGETDHHPKWSVAIKFPPKEAITTITDIEWNLGPSGRLTPVAILEPTDLDGTTVSRASCHNLGKIKSDGFFIGSKVILQKKGDIIPQIIRVVEIHPLQIFNHPDKCPKCNTDLVIIIGKADNTEHLECHNDNCIGKEIKLLESAIKSLKIQRIGLPTVEKIYQAGITKIEDLFNKDLYNKENILSTGLYKEGRALDIIIDEVYNIKELQLWNIINSMNFDDCGKSLSKELANYYNDLPYG